jgi:serine protease Do
MSVIQIERAAPRAAQRKWFGGTVAALAGAVLIFSTSLATAAIPDGFADLVEKVKPAVVNIATTQQVAARRGGQQFQIPPELRGSPFEEFLRRFMQPPGSGGGGDEDNNDSAGPDNGPGTAMALGSGFIIDPTGYVVTNNHVVQNADKIQITLADGRKFDGHVVGRDDKTDLGLVKIDTDQSLPYVSWGDSDKARVGDWVLAVGNPFGLGGSVTAGIISARGRDIQSGPFDDFLQIDASINRGNSGGPSFDRNGQVIGINTAIYSPNGGSIGIGFAIPSSVAKPIVEQLRTQGHIDRGWLGVSIQPVSKEIADSLGLKDEKGALVATIQPNSPAAKAGVKQGDVIRSIDGHTVDQFRDVPRLVANAGPDKSMSLGVWRDGKEIKVDAKLGAMPSEQTASADEGDKAQGAPEPKSSSVLGLTLAAITPQAREQLGLPADTKGAVVRNVKRGSAAADAGLAPGDIIVKAGDKAVAGPRDVVDSVRAAEKSERKAVLLLVKRQANERFVAIPVGKG